MYIECNGCTILNLLLMFFQNRKSVTHLSPSYNTKCQNYSIEISCQLPGESFSVGFFLLQHKLDSLILKNVQKNSFIFYFQ